MKNIYLLLAIIGTIIPYLFFLRFIQIEGINLTLFIDQLFGNYPASGFTADLLISSLIFWIYMYKNRQDDNPLSPLPFIALNLTIGLSCALPAYLYALEKRKASI